MADFYHKVKLLSTEYAVEATSFEVLALWRDHHEQVEWEQNERGYVFTIAKIGKELIRLDCRWVWIDSHLIMFYDCCSNLCRLDFIRDWLKVNGPLPRDGRERLTNAMNFHHVLHYCKNNPPVHRNFVL